MFFELEDIKRRHTLYFDTNNAGVWSTAPENTLRWNVTRGIICGVTATAVSEFAHNFYINWTLLLKQYQGPETVSQFYKFTKATLSLENFKRSMRTRLQYSLAIGSLDWAARIAMFRYLNQGWHRTFGAFEYGFLRKVPGSMFAALVTAPLGIPLECARMAYYADKTFPKELQRGYTSYFNALLRIPFEEGPYYLFKNSFPLFIKNFLQTLTLFYSYDWMKDKLSVMNRHSEVPYFPIKAVTCFLATYLSIILSYPVAVCTKEMVDLWPKPPSGVCPYDGNYRTAASHIWYARNLNNYFPGMLKNYAGRQFPQMFLMCWLADSFGVFSYWNVDMYSGAGTNSWEDTYA